MATADKITIRADEEFRERVERYEERAGKASRTDAIKELVDVGLREQERPLLYRAKDRVVEWVHLLSIIGVALFVLGVTTDLVTATDGLIAAVFSLGLAAALLAGYELARALAGSNEVGVRLRAVVAMVVGSSD